MTNQSDSKITIRIDNQTIENRKYFVYRDRQYEIDFDKIKKNCRYFYKNRKQYKHIEYINLLNDDDKSIDLTEEAINNFIKICQNEEIQLSHSSINSLHYLSTKYDYPELQRITNEYLIKYSSELCIKTLLFKINTNDKNSIKNDTKDEENFISQHLNKYINEQEEEMIKLPVYLLDRILNNYYGYKGEKEEVDEKKMIDFLFKILDFRGTEASILFSHVDFKRERMNTMNRLIEEYSEIFDFNMLNSTHAKTTTELSRELSKQKENYSLIFFAYEAIH